MSDATDFQHWKLETDEAGIAWLGFDVAESSTNTLGSKVMQELDRALDAIAAEPPGAVIVHSLKKNGFAAGADINEFTGLENESQAFELIRSGQKVLGKLAALPCPTVAMIHGFALGGGLELALACRYRIAADDPGTQLGFPEVKLGIHPGFGGTVRSVNVMGVTNAMKLMLTGHSLRGKKALAQGLIDRLAKPVELKEHASNLALNSPSPGRAPLMQRLMGLAPVRPLVAQQLRKQVSGKARKEHYPAPYAIIDLWRKTDAKLQSSSFEAEAHSIARLMCGDTARNLVRVFFLQNRLKGLGRKSDFKLRRMHVVGAGTMGGDIAAWCASRGISVSLQDQKADYVDKAMSRARKFFEKKLKHEKKIKEAMNRLEANLDGGAVDESDLVIEAIVEDRDAKVELLRDVESRLGAGAVLATNTSSIPLEEIATELPEPERLIGLHFFNPATKMPLVEVISSRYTDADTATRGLAAARAMGKLPVPVKSAPGFLVNRVLAPYMMAALQAWDEGIALEALDRAAEDFGMPMGPAELADTVGLDVLFSVAEVLKDTIEIKPPRTMEKLVQDGKLGRKSAQGLYRWEDGKAVKDNTRAGGADTALQDRLILPFLNEAVRALREGIVEDADLLDAGAIFGTGFAPFRGGPIHYARTDAAGFKKRLDDLAVQYGDFYRPDVGWDTL
jgi:3-hydroxyacyl-CoA dehydrogenase/enoyl-CoA hydratase/3-hydroxybutyryl-CoA epimerase